MRKVRQGRVNSLVLDSLNNFLRFLAIAVVLSCLATSIGMIKAEEYCLLGCLGLIEKVWLWIVQFAYQRYAWAGPFQSLIIGYLRGLVSPQQETVFKMSQHHNIQKIKNIINTSCSKKKWYNIPNTPEILTSWQHTFFFSATENDFGKEAD